jgi:crotonobetainyl-CoA:carnitine CoA-transferase CaiB-like acyl-CoA transferase
MSDNLFTFMYWAIGNGLAAGQWPGNGADRVTGGSPRYRLYATADERAVAAAPLEQKFWEEFCTIIGLAPELRDDRRDPDATTRRVAEIIRSETSETWRQRFAGRDCCCSIVADLREALNDPHVAARGLFSRMLVNEAGDRLPALPVPIDGAFRGPADEALAAPHLGTTP